jgi:hypothetical protein
MYVVRHYDECQALAVFLLTLSPELTHHQICCSGISEHEFSLVAACGYKIGMATH